MTKDTCARLSLIALVAVVVIGTLILLGPQIASIFNNIHNNL